MREDFEVLSCTQTRWIIIAIQIIVHEWATPKYTFREDVAILSRRQYLQLQRSTKSIPFNILAKIQNYVENQYRKAFETTRNENTPIWKINWFDELWFNQSSNIAGCFKSQFFHLNYDSSDYCYRLTVTVNRSNKGVWPISPIFTDTPRSWIAISFIFITLRGGGQTSQE